MKMSGLIVELIAPPGQEYIELLKTCRGDKEELVFTIPGYGMQDEVSIGITDGSDDFHGLRIASAVGEQAWRREQERLISLYEWLHSKIYWHQEYIKKELLTYNAFLIEQWKKGVITNDASPVVLAMRQITLWRRLGEVARAAIAQEEKR